MTPMATNQPPFPLDAQLERQQLDARPYRNMRKHLGEATNKQELDELPQAPENACGVDAGW